MTTEVQECQNGARDLDIDLQMRSKCRGHEISIAIAAFRLAPPIGGLLVLTYN